MKRWRNFCVQSASNCENFSLEDIKWDGCKTDHASHDKTMDEWKIPEVQRPRLREKYETVCACWTSFYSAARKDLASIDRFAMSLDENGQRCVKRRTDRARRFLNEIV